MMRGRFLFVLVLSVFGAVDAASQGAPAKKDTKALFIPIDKVGEKVTLLEGNAVLIHDGDTLTMVTGNRKVHKIRLRGCDAPEEKQPQAERSKENLGVMIQGMDVTVVLSGAEMDGAYFGTVYSDGKDVGLELIRLGMAWYSTRNDLPMSGEEIRKYLQAEKQARDSRAGIWSEPTRLSPWDFRAGNKAASPAAVPGPTPKVRDSAEPASSAVPAGAIIANVNSGIYHWPGCSGYQKVAVQNRVLFNSRAEAEAAGYRAARNCK